MDRFKAFTKREQSIAIVVAVVILACVGLWYLDKRETTAVDDLTVSVARARGILEDNKTSLHIPAIEKTRDELLKQLEVTGPQDVNGSEVTLSVWGWMSESGMVLVNFEYQPGQRKLGDVEVGTHSYKTLMRGQAPAVHKFLTLLTKSKYAPAITDIGMERPTGASTWAVDMSFVVYSRDVPGQIAPPVSAVSPTPAPDGITIPFRVQ